MVRGKPGKEYLRMIASGLRETYPKMTNNKICSYFLGADGDWKGISREKLLDWIQ